MLYEAQDVALSNDHFRQTIPLGPWRSTRRTAAEMAAAKAGATEQNRTEQNIHVAHTPRCSYAPCARFVRSLVSVASGGRWEIVRSARHFLMGKNEPRCKFISALTGAVHGCRFSWPQRVENSGGARRRRRLKAKPKYKYQIKINSFEKGESGCSDYSVHCVLEMECILV